MTMSSMTITAERRAVIAQSGQEPPTDWVIVTRGLKRHYDMGREIGRRPAWR